MKDETLLIGHIPANTDRSKAREIYSREEVENVRDGELIRRWDFVSIASSDSLRPSVLAPLRHRGDPLADALVEKLGLGPGEDGLKAIQSELELEFPRQEIKDFWDSVNREPPEGVSAMPSSLSKASLDKSTTARTPSLAEGQAVFWKYCGPIFGSLMHFSLAGGFSAPHLSAVMKETGYLTSPSPDATHKRLLETTLFVLDAMTDMRVGEGKGFKSAVRVRILHAQVRRRIRMGKGKLKQYDEKVSGIPINQEDLCAVLGSFMIAPLWGMRRTGIYLTNHEMSSYQAAWRHVGFYLGIEVELLERYYGRTFATAEMCFASLAFDVFPEEVPLDGYTTATYRILSAVSNRPPRNSTIGHHLEYSRRLLGNKLADQLAVPRGTWRDRLGVESEIWMSWLFIHFGKLYPRKGWEYTRQQWFAHVIELLVVWQLGERRTLFAWRDEDRHAKKLGIDEGEEPGIKMGKAVGTKVKATFRWLVAEMAVVCFAGAVGATFGLELCLRAAYRLHI